jgi:flagellar basal body-associated protein FliL
VRIKVLIIFFTILLAASVQAVDFPLDALCSTDDECSFCEDTDEFCYCEFDEGICYLLAEDFDEYILDQEVPSEEVTELKERINFLENLQLSTQEEINTLDTTATSVAQRLASVEQQYFLLQQDLVVKEQTEQILQTDIKTLSTGLATLQDNVVETQNELGNVETQLTKEQKRSKTLLILLISFIIFVVAVLLAVYMTQQPRKKRVHPELSQFITSHIQQGKKYGHIKNALVDAGWSENDAAWAYKETMRKNYSSYKQNSSTSASDPKKVVSLLVIGIVLVLLIVLLLRGVSTGSAIYFDSAENFETAVQTHLQSSFTDNQFYPLVDFASVCVQVVDGEKTVSYVVTKTPVGHVVGPAITSCDADSRYDFAVKFLEWETFTTVANNQNCEILSSVNRREKNFIILPSQYVLPGFVLNPREDITPFCSALNVCLDAEELESIGC